MAGLFGLFAGLIVAYVKIPGIVVTLATSMIIGGLALVIMPQPGGTVDEIVGRLVNDQPLLIPNSFLILLFVMAVWKYLKNARLGRALYAAGGNPFSAYASGLSVEGAKIAAYVGSALLAAVAGIVVCGKTMTGDATIGNPYTLSSIAGTVLGGASFMGGVGTMKGAVAGALILGVLVNILFFLGLLQSLPEHRRGDHPPCSRRHQRLREQGRQRLKVHEKAVNRNSLRFLVPYLLFILCWLIVSLAVHGYGTIGHFLYIVQFAGLLGIVAAGQTLVIVSGGIDLSVGALITLSAVITTQTAFSAHLAFPLAVLAGLLGGVAFGLLNGTWDRPGENTSADHDSRLLDHCQWGVFAGDEWGTS